MNPSHTACVQAFRRDVLRQRQTSIATGFTQPLLPVRAQGPKPARGPYLKVEPADVLVSGFKPSDDGQALIIRLWGASAKPQSATLEWAGHPPQALFLSDTSERRGEKAGGPIAVPSRGLVCLRAEFH